MGRRPAVTRGVGGGLATLLGNWLKTLPISEPIPFTGGKRDMTTALAGRHTDLIATASSVLRVPIRRTLSTTDDFRGGLGMEGTSTAWAPMVRIKPWLHAMRKMTYLVRQEIEEPR